jgi:hypothetical protein
VDGFGHPGYARTEYEVAACQAYVTGATGAGHQLEHDGTLSREAQPSIVSIPPLEFVRDWSNLPASHQPPLESILDVKARLGGDVTRFYILAVDREGAGYDTVLICRERDVTTRVTEATVGAWSQWALESFQIGGCDQPASVRFKLLELAPDGSHLKLYRSQVTFADGFTYPEELASDLIQRFGPYQEHASMHPYVSGMTDFDTALEECEYQGLWFADVANHMLHERDCSLFICHWHLFDYLNHVHLSDVDPVGPGYDEEDASRILDYFRRAYQVGDRILGKLWAAADSETYVSILSDHGAYPDIRVANIRKFLVQQGFTVLNRDVESVELDQISENDIDWDHTRAYLKDEKGFDIFINAPAGEEFDRIEQKLLLALRTWVDTDVGRTPVAIALPKRDAYLLGQWGDQCGDVVFTWDHGYVSGYFGEWKRIVGGGAVGEPQVHGAHHGGFIPTREKSKLSSTFASFLLAGPDVKPGYERPANSLGYIHATDVVPTLCHVLGVAPPAQSQGAIAYDLFEGHQMEPSRTQDERS